MHLLVLCSFVEPIRRHSLGDIPIVSRDAARRAMSLTQRPMLGSAFPFTPEACQERQIRAFLKAVLELTRGDMSALVFCTQ